MSIEIRRKPDGSLKSKWWYGSYQVDGRRVVSSLGVLIDGKVPTSLRDTGDATFEQSRGKATEALNQLRREAMKNKSASAQLEQLYELRTGEKVGSVALKDMAKAWMEAPHARERSPRYVDQSLTNIRSFVEFIQKRYPNVTSMDRVNRQMAETWLASLDEDGLCPATYSDKLVLLRSAFKGLLHRAGMPLNPFDGIPTRRRDTVHRKPFTPAELKRIITHADPIVRPVIITGICTAMRRGDCCLLKWADVDMKQGFVVVKTSKTGETAEIPILPMLWDALNKAAEARKTRGADVAALKTAEDPLDAYVWREAAEMFLANRYGITYRTAKAIDAAGIKEKLAPTGGQRQASVKDFHSLRTTWITLALSAGVPMELVRRVTGHTTTDVVLTYYFRPGRKDFKRVLKNAMPKLLNTGFTPSPSAPDKGAKENILDICATATAKTWRKDLKRIAELVEAL